MGRDFINYQIIKNSPPPMSWESYDSYLNTKYKELLSAHANNEKVFQIFFEQHPCLVPGAFGILPQSGHTPYGMTLITQPRLIGLESRIPDFMWVAFDSATIYPVLIEIEAPAKRWFTRSGKPSSEFVEAHDQLTEWRTWFLNPNHQLMFFDYYKLPRSVYSGKTVRPLFVLIYGRYQEFIENPRLNEKRRQLQRDDEFLMTYDRITPNYHARNMFCSRVNNGKYVAVSISPTIVLGPAFASDYLLINEKEQAIIKNELISEERKAFLISRFSYWEEYAKRRGLKICNTGDFE